MTRAIQRILSGNILVFSITDMLGNFARALVFPYASLYVLALGGNAANIGLINSLALLAGFVMLPIAGYITDRTNRVRILVLSGLLTSVFLVFTVTATSWQVLAAASLLFGMVVFQFPAYASLVADSLPPGDRGRGISNMNMVSSSLAIVAPFIAGLLIERYTTNLGIRILYLVMLVTYLLGTTIQYFFLHEVSATPRGGLKLSDLTRTLWQSYRTVPALLKAMSRPLKALAVVVLLSFLVNAVSSPFWVVYATKEIGLSTVDWGLILLIAGIVQLLAFFPAGLLVDRWGRKNTLLVALVISLIATPLFVIWESFMGVLIVRIAFAVAFSFALPACTALMADLVPRKLRGQIMAAIGQGGIMLAPAAGGVGGPALGYLFIPPVMLASLAGGYLYTLNPAYPWIIAFVLTLLSIAVTVFFVRDAQSAEV